MQVAAAAEPAQRDVVGGRLEEVGRSARGAPVLGDGSAQRHAPEPAQRPERRFQVVSAHAVEVDVDSLRGSLAEKLRRVPRTVVEGGVETELAEEVGHLLVRARAADHAVPAELRELRREASDGAGRGRHPDDVAGAQSRDVEQPRIGGQAHAAERPEVPLRGRAVDIEPGQRAEPAERRRAGGDHGVVPPAGGMRDGVAGGEAVGARLDDLADRHDPVHRRAQAERREVPGGRTLGEPQPQAGIDRRPRVAHQDLARTGLAHPDLDDAEVAGPEHSARARGELHLAADQRLRTVHALTPGAP